MPPRKLRAVEADESAPEPELPKTVTAAAACGSTRELLVAMRERIAVAVENANTPARDLAALTKRLMEVQNEIAAIDARETQEDSGGVVADEAFDASAV